ncbi:MAG: hypothetical protein ABSG41_06790 [Bryobacteraceae bacterium]|jgi:hypothetical protein
MNPERVRWCAILTVIVLLAGGWQAPPVAANTAPPASRLPTAGEIDSILKELSDITGFRIRKQLPFALITRDEVNRYIKEQIKDSVKPDEIRAEEATLKKFGFAPADFDLKKTTIDLLTEQAAAFYDFKRKKLFISDWATVNMRDVALIHELAHALADQNFPIKRFLDKSSDDSEGSLARQAVVEGQASWLMFEVEARRAGRSLAEESTARQFLNADVDTPDEDYPVFNNAPLYLRRTLTFPYSEGGKFQQAVFLHDGRLAFARVFREPPVSSAQIMHPVQYFENVGPTSPDLPKPARHTKLFIAGTMGELETRILLEQYAGPDLAGELGPKLKGSNYRIDETKPDHRLTLVYASEWSDDDAASRYFTAYRKVLRGKWKRFDIADERAGRFSGKSEDGYFLVTRDGKRVLSEEGFGEAFDSLPIPARVDNIPREGALRASGR